MKHLLRVSAVLFFILTSFSLGFSGDPSPPEAEILPEIPLPVPKSEDEQQYLGVKGKTRFTIPQIQAKVVIVEIFSMYCPHCQREAPAVNKLYQTLETDPRFKDKVKLIGIGVGNSDFEVNFFKKNYTIPFPLFSDGDFAIHKKIGEVRTPYFIAIRNYPDKTHQVFYSKLGAIQDTAVFLNLVHRQIETD